MAKPENHLAMLRRSPTSVAANLRLKEAVLVLAPGSSDETARAQTFELLRNAPKPDDPPKRDALNRLVTSYERWRLITLEQKLGVLADLRASFPADSPVTSLLDREIEDREQERAAIEGLHNAFFRGSVIVLGVRKGSGRPHQPIPTTFFSQTRALLWRSNEIGQSESIARQTRAAHGEEYTDVLVDGPSFFAWMKGSSAPIAKASISTTKKKAATQGAVADAVAALWPNGIPMNLKSKDQNDQIREWCLQNGHSKKSLPSDRTIVRFFSRSDSPKR